MTWTILVPMRDLERPVGCCPPQRVPSPRKGSRNAPLLSCLRAAADPTRLRMLQLLVAAKAPVCVCDITARFRLGQPTISHHLRILRQAGLVSTSRRGIWAHYAVRPAGLAVLWRGVADLAAAAGESRG
jgi:ArsR family transcriptional regulator, arsenate/arsenite/antimonite-responsive transcriptional repressor